MIERVIFKIVINLESYNDIGLYVPSEDVWLIAAGAQYEIGSITP